VRPHRPFTRSRRRAILFAVAALCFFLPFGTVSCGDEKVHVTGVQFVSQTVPGAHEEPPYGRNLAQEVEDEGFTKAGIALLALLVGLALAAWRPQAIGKAFLVTLCGILALLSLPATAIALLADVTLGPGYVAALGIELWVAGDCLVLLVRRRRGSAPPGVPRARPILPPGAVPLSGAAELDSDITRHAASFVR
jgi:hypothetical protein